MWRGMIINVQTRDIKTTKVNLKLWRAVFSRSEWAWHRHKESGWRRKRERIISRYCHWYFIVFSFDRFSMLSISVVFFYSSSFLSPHFLNCCCYIFWRLFIPLFLFPHLSTSLILFSSFDIDPQLNPNFIYPFFLLTLEEIRIVHRRKPSFGDLSHICGGRESSQWNFFSSIIFPEHFHQTFRLLPFLVSLMTRRKKRNVATLGKSRWWQGGKIYYIYFARFQFRFRDIFLPFFWADIHNYCFRVLLLGL